MFLLTPVPVMVWYVYVHFLLAPPSTGWVHQFNHIHSSCCNLVQLLHRSGYKLWPVTTALSYTLAPLHKYPYSSTLTRCIVEPTWTAKVRVRVHPQLIRSLGLAYHHQLMLTHPLDCIGNTVGSDIIYSKTSERWTGSANHITIFSPYKWSARRAHLLLCSVTVSVSDEE